MAKTDVGVAAGLRPLYSFDQLVIGPNNHVAVAACLEVVKVPGETYNPLFIYGPPGVGKTHLMQAVAHQVLLQNPSFKVRYISAERFMSEILTAISEDKVLDVRRHYSTLDLLIIDDVQYMTESKISQEELFHVFNNMHQANRQVILAADRPPNQLTTLNKNIRSRLEWGLSTDVKVPQEATRIEILKKKQQNIPDLVMTDAMLHYVARSLKSNVRELEGFLKRLHAYVTLSHQEVTMDLVKSVVREILPEGTQENVDDEVSEPAPPPPKNVHVNGHKKEAAPIPPVAATPEFPKAPAPSLEPAPPPPRPPRPPEPSTGSVSFDKLLEAIDINAVEPPVPVAPAKPVPPLVKTAVPASPPPPRSPAPVAPPAPPPPTPVADPELPDDSVAEDDEALAGQKEVGAVFFYPEACDEALQTVSRKFQEVIKKHKLKFRLKRVHNEPYGYKGKINYSSFVDVCKANKVPVAIVIGPPPENILPEQDFYDLLTVTLDVQGVSLQLVNWGEINKDYRYLNLALDIALVRSR